MKTETKNYFGQYWYIKWNNNDLNSLKMAEKKKANFENKGFTLRNEMINSITGECTFTYSAPSCYR